MLITIITTITTIIISKVVVAVMADSIRRMRVGMVVVGIRVSRVVGISNLNITYKEVVAVTTATNTAYLSSTGNA